LLLLRQTFLKKVVLLDIVDVERNINDHIWEMTPILGLVEANRWKMAPLGMLLFLFPYASFSFSL
jgi:hypothetical protein